MSADEGTPLDEQCASLLAAWHEALLAGETATPLTGPEVTPELQARLERNLACLRLLEQTQRQVGRPVFAHRAPAGVNPNDLLATIGRFRIRRELGRGGYGIVFQAYDPQLDREVALKVPRPEAVLTPELRERFLREARAAAVLDHPNVVPVYDGGEVGPVCYIASAYCPGTTLDAWLKARAEPVPWREAAALMATLAEAVQHAHAQRVVHRDLKPSNVLLQIADGRRQKEKQADASSRQSAVVHLHSAIPKITDFGLAKFDSLEPEAVARQYETQTGAILGTPRYMAPEQAVGKSQGVGPAADIHALGAILYEVLTGRPPFVAETVLDTLEQVRSHEPLPPSRLRPKLPRDLETICLRCLQKDPAKRYASAGDLANDLGRFLAGEPIQARPIRAWERAVKWARRRPTAAALVAVSSLASLLFVASLVVGIVREKERREEIEQTSYYNGIASAEHEISAGNWGQGEELLEQCPQRLRGWEWHYLKRLRYSHTPPISLLPMGERISMTGGFDLAFHPDGRLLAIPGTDNSIQIWEASASHEKPVLTLRGHQHRVLSLMFSPDGRRLASASEDKTVKVWDITAGLEGREPVFTLCHPQPVIGVAFSADGRLLASASGEKDTPGGETNRGGEVRVWNTVSGKLLWTFLGQARPKPFVANPAFSPDGRWLAWGSVRNSVKVWDLTTGQEIYTLRGHTEPILSLTFSPDGNRLISAGLDHHVNVWDLRNAGQGVLAPQWTMPDFSTSVWCMALSPDGSRLAIGGPTADGNVRIYDMTSGTLLHTLRGDYRIVSVAFSPDGRRLAAAGHDRIIRLWDTRTGREVLRLRGHNDIVGCVLFSPDGQRLASASADGTVRVWDASLFDENADPRIRTLRADNGEFFGVDFSPDGRLLAAASADGLIKLWNIQTGQAHRSFHGHNGAVLCLAFSPDGRRLLSGSMDQTVKLWDVQTGDELPLPGRQTFSIQVRGVAFRPPDGKAFATVAQRMLQLWNAETGQQLFEREADPEFLNCVAFDRTGKRVATAGHNATAKVWDAQSGKLISKFNGHKTSVFCVAFHPMENCLASGDSDFNVKLWAADSPTGRAICTLSGHTDYVFGVAFSPDGKYLASASWKEVIVWDVSNFEKVKKLPPKFDRLAGKILWIAFSRDGKRLAAASGYKGKGEIKIWDAGLWERSVASSQ